MHSWGIARIVLIPLVVLAVVGGNSPGANAAKRSNDRFGLRLGAWPQSDISGTLASFIQFHNDPDTIYRATIEETGHVVPFMELYGLFNISGMWWVEISAGFSQRTNVEVDGIRITPPLPPTDPKGDSAANKILLGQGRVDFIPLFLGARAVKEMGKANRPHNIYARGGLSMLIAAEQPNVIHPRLTHGAYSEGTKAAFGLLIGGGGEYYLNKRFGLVGDIAYRLSDLKYTKDGNFDLSGIWVSTGVTLHVR